MKLANYISICGIALCLLSACDSDLEKITYDQDAVKPAILQEIEASYTLAAEKAEETAVTFQWSKPETGYQAAVTHTVEIALAETEFKKTGVLASGTNVKANITVVALNRAVLKLLNNVIPAEPVGVEVRILSSISNAATPFISNVVKTKLTPYSMEKEYPFLAVRGGYCDWDWLNSQKVYSEKENPDFAGMIYFGQGGAAKGWKLSGDKDWAEGSDNWGYSTGTNEAEETILVAKGDDIKAFSKVSYYVDFNNETGMLKMTKGHNSWGINKKGASTTDKELALSMSTINGATVHALTASLELKAGDQWRIRPDNADKDAMIPADVEHALSVEGDYFKVGEDGTYIITWIFNKVTPQLSIKKQ